MTASPQNVLKIGMDVQNHAYPNDHTTRSYDRSGVLTPIMEHRELR